MEARGDGWGYQARGKRVHWVTHTLGKKGGGQPGMNHFYHRHQNSNAPQGVDTQVSMGQVGICRVSFILQTKPIIVTPRQGCHVSQRKQPAT